MNFFTGFSFSFKWVGSVAGFSPHTELTQLCVGSATPQFGAARAKQTESQIQQRTDLRTRSGCKHDSAGLHVRF